MIKFINALQCMSAGSMPLESLEEMRKVRGGIVSVKSSLDISVTEEPPRRSSSNFQTHCRETECTLMQFKFTKKKTCNMISYNILIIYGVGQKAVQFSVAYNPP